MSTGWGGNLANKRPKSNKNLNNNIYASLPKNNNNNKVSKTIRNTNSNFNIIIILIIIIVILGIIYGILYILHINNKLPIDLGIFPKSQKEQK